MKTQAKTLNERKQDLSQAGWALERTAAQWLNQRATHGPFMPRTYDLALDLAMADYRRAQRRLDEAHKRARPS